MTSAYSQDKAPHKIKYLKTENNPDKQSPDGGIHGFKL
jgi:hypothetical protein